MAALLPRHMLAGPTLSHTLRASEATWYLTQQATVRSPLPVTWVVCQAPAWPPAALPGTPSLAIFGPTVVSPNDKKDLLVYYGLPITCKPGSASCTPGPYAYYAPGGTQELTPGNEAQLLGQSPAPASSLFGTAPGPAPGSTMALTPAGLLPSAQGPAAAFAPAASPAASSALCACNPKDTTPRSVKIEVLSTAYNSTATDTIKFNAYLTFTHPTQSLNSSQVRVFTRQPTDSSGTVTTPGTVTLLQPVSPFACLVAAAITLLHCD